MGRHSGVLNRAEETPIAPTQRSSRVQQGNPGRATAVPL